MRSLSRWFQLINLAEDNERVRRLRRRERAHADAPRAGSLRAAVAHLAERGTTADELREMLAGAELRLVMTAHPTEARRRTTVEKLARIFARLRDLDERPPVPGDEAADAPRARRHDPGAVGLRRGARRLADPARRGPRRPRLLRLDAASRRPRALPRARGGGRGGLPGRGHPRPAAAHVRLLDGRRPRRQPERHGGRHRRGARDDADGLPAPARRAARAARPAGLALRPARRPLARARGRPGPPRHAVPRGGRAAAATQPGGALPPLLLPPRHARARDARGPRDRIRHAGRADRGPADGPALAARGQGPVRGGHAAARHDPPGRGLRLPFRAARHPRARRPPRRRDRRGAVRARRPRGLPVARARRAQRPARARDRAAPAARPRRSQRPLGGDAGGDRHVPHARRAAARAPRRRGPVLRDLGHRGAGPRARGAAADEGERAGRGRRRAGAAADRAAVRVRGLARAVARDPARAARAPRLPHRAARGRRRAGGDDRLLGLKQGRGLRRLRLGDLPRADRAGGRARAPRRRVALLPRPRRGARPRRRAGQPRDPRAAARAPSRAG